jgi:hypothetical protein
MSLYVGIFYINLYFNRKEERIRQLETELDQEKRMADNMVNDMVCVLLLKSQNFIHSEEMFNECIQYNANVIADKSLITLLFIFLKQH